MLVARMSSASEAALPSATAASLLRRGEGGMSSTAMGSSWVRRVHGAECTIVASAPRHGSVTGQSPPYAPPRTHVQVTRATAQSRAKADALGDASQVVHGLGVRGRIRQDPHETSLNHGGLASCGLSRQRASWWSCDLAHESSRCRCRVDGGRRRTPPRCPGRSAERGRRPGACGAMPPGDRRRRA